LLPPDYGSVQQHKALPQGHHLLLQMSQALLEIILILPAMDNFYMFTA
jgi:hypothetical protein